MTITNERLAELERLLPNLKAWPNQYVQPQDVLELIRLARLAEVRKAECMAWRERFDVPINVAIGSFAHTEMCEARVRRLNNAKAATDAAERGEA